MLPVQGPSPKYGGEKGREEREENIGYYVLALSYFPEIRSQ